MKGFIKYFLFLFCLNLLSCATYVDNTVGKVRVLDGYLMSEKSFNQLVYEAKKTYKVDTEIVNPTSYSINIPKKIKEFFVGRIGKCWIDYGHNQFVILVQNETPNLSESYIISEDDWQKKVRGNFDIEVLHKLKLDELHVLKNRSSMIYNKDSISVILYNIKNENFKKFAESIKTIQVGTTNMSK